MDLTLLQQLFTQGGISLVIAFVAYKAIGKLYDDMRTDSRERESKLMEHLDRVADTLEKIDSRIAKMDERINSLEELCRKEHESK